jgi:hypothetical protein
MADLDPATPRFGHLGPGDGHYESYFLKAHHPSEPVAFWMRHTIHQRPGAPMTAAVWLTIFDGDEVRAGKATVDAGQLEAPPGGYVRIGGSECRPDGADGSLASPSLDADWSFRWRAEEQPLQHLPAGWMYNAKVPRTKSYTPHPGAVFSGALTAGGRRYDLDGWVGVVSHNWGSEHAERWVYAHCGQFEGRDERTWLELVLGRIRIGPVVMPWLGNGVLSLDGVRHRLGGPQRARQTRVDEHPTRCRFVLAGDDARVEAELSAPAQRFVAWRYADPDGPEHHSLHSSLTDLRMEVRAGDGAAVELLAPAAATYELGLRESDHGLAVQPYADG